MSNVCVKFPDAGQSLTCTVGVRAQLVHACEDHVKHARRTRVLGCVLAWSLVTSLLQGTCLATVSCVSATTALLSCALCCAVSILKPPSQHILSAVEVLVRSPFCRPCNRAAKAQVEGPIMHTQQLGHLI